MAWTKLKTVASAGVLALLAVATATLVIHKVDAQTNIGKAAAKTSNFSLAGYATPEAAYQSLLWAMNNGDLEKVQAACTPEEAQRLRRMAEGKSAGEIRRLLIEEANHRIAYQLDQKEDISDDEVRLHLLVQPYPGHPHVGHDVQVLQKIDGQWKYAGKYGVDVKEK